MSSIAFPATEWQKGTGEDVILGTENISDIDKISFENISDPLDRLLSNYRQGCALAYATAATITVQSGEITCSNAAGTIRRMRQNTSNTTVSWSDIDTGAEATSTTYYIYAVSDADAVTFTCKISTSSTTPTGVTYYKKLGSFYNDSSGNITQISNDGFYSNLGAWTSKSAGVAYQASTDGFVTAYRTTDGRVRGYTDSSSSPTTLRIQNASTSEEEGICFPVLKGDYYKVRDYDSSGTEQSTATVFWTPLD